MSHAFSRRSFIAFSGACVASALIDPTAASAFSKKGHDDMVASVLFGGYGKPEGKKANEALNLLENAAALCIDQSGGNGAKYLKALKKRGVKNLPNLNEINLPGGSHHRRYSHMGWHYNYTETCGSEKNNKWQLRKRLLISVVDRVFDFGIVSEFKSGSLHFTDGTGCDAFAELLYCVHVLGDYDENITQVIDNGSYKLTNEILPYASSISNPDEHNLIDDITEALTVLVNTESKDYKRLSRELSRLARRAKRIGRVCDENSANRFEKNLQDLEDCLIDYVPELLRECDFFTAVFPK